MRNGIHPEYRTVVFQDTSTGATFRTRSTIATDRTIVDCIRSYAQGFIFTTSLSPVLVAGALASVRHLKQSAEERRAQQEAAAMLKGKFAAAGLPLMASETHIVPLLVGIPWSLSYSSVPGQPHGCGQQSRCRQLYHDASIHEPER